MRKTLKKVLAMVAAGVFTFSITAGLLPVNAAASGISKTGEKIGKVPLNLDEGSEYHAYILFQAKESWVFRNFFYDGTEGIENTKIWNNLVTTCKLDEAQPVDGEVQDAVIKGNGHYTVKITNMNGSPSAQTAGSEPEFSILGFSTDIPKNDTIKFQNVKVKIDGVEKGTRTGDAVYYDKDAIVDPGVIVVEVMNTWHEECDSMSLQLPQDSVEISFDVSGFHYDNPDAVEEKADTDSKSEKIESTKKTSSEEAEMPIVPIAVAGVVVVAVIVIAVVARKSRK